MGCGKHQEHQLCLYIAIVTMNIFSVNQNSFAMYLMVVKNKSQITVQNL